MRICRRSPVDSPPGGFLTLTTLGAQYTASLTRLEFVRFTIRASTVERGHPYGISDPYAGGLPRGDPLPFHETEICNKYRESPGNMRYRGAHGNSDIILRIWVRGNPDDVRLRRMRGNPRETWVIFLRGNPRNLQKRRFRGNPHKIRRS